MGRKKYGWLTVWPKWEIVTNEIQADCQPQCQCKKIMIAWWRTEKSLIILPETSKTSLAINAWYRRDIDSEENKSEEMLKFQWGPEKGRKGTGQVIHHVSEGSNIDKDTSTEKRAGN